MLDRTKSVILTATMAILTATLFSTSASAATFKVLYSFQGGNADGQHPGGGGLIMDRNGNLYGTTGEFDTSGTVFELSPTSSGEWTEKVLHSFAGGTDGAMPTSLVLDASGNLYGTTYSGDGSGIVFELTPATGGKWQETVVHRFGGADGGGGSGLTIDRAGNLYGTTLSGGPNYNGTVFELVPAASGEWEETILYSFEGGGDGAEPRGGPILDAVGNLYGITEGYSGTVYQLMPKRGGAWEHMVLHQFSNGNDGSSPYGGLAFDGSGNLYGTTANGGSEDFGTVYELMPQEGGGNWTEDILHSFHTESKGGVFADGTPVFDEKGNFYATTDEGGVGGGGEVFEFTHTQGGGWPHMVLHDFGSVGAFGAGPVPNLVLDTAGNIYGMTGMGGTHGLGTVFEIIP